MSDKYLAVFVIFFCSLGLTQCDNVLNRAAYPEYTSEAIPKDKLRFQEKQDEEIKSKEIQSQENLDQTINNELPNACPDIATIKGKINRLVTEQGIILKPGSQIVLQQIVAIQGDYLYADLFDRDKSLDASQLSIVVCEQTDANEFSKNPLHFLQIINGADFDGGLKASIPLLGFKNKKLVLMLQNHSQKKQTFNLDIRYSEHEGEPWTVLDKITKQEPASGFLDLHIHQTGAMAFNQGWYWGSHEIGSLAERLPDCRGEHGSMFEFEYLLDGKITGPIAYAIAPKNDVDDFMRSHRQMTQAKDYVRSDDRKHQQVAYERLKEAHERGLNLIISTVVENNILLDIMYGMDKGRKDWYPSVMESIHRQIKSLKAIDEQSDWFEIVYDPWQARRVINEGKLAVVLGAEFNDIFPPSDGPWKQQLYDLYNLGLRHLQPVHKSDSQFSSTHKQGFPFDNLNLLRALIRKEIPNWPAIERTFGQDDPETGLSAAGYDLLDEMVRLNMIIDLSHASLASQREMSAYLVEDKNFYPFIYSHWSARSPELLDQVKQVGGMIAFGWGEPVPELEKYQAPVETLACKDFVKERAELYQRYIAYGINFSLASDMNGFAHTPAPNFGPDYCHLSEKEKDRSDQYQLWQDMKQRYPNYPEWVARYWAQGAPDISLLPGIIYDLREILKMDTHKIDSSTEDFIRMWERTYDERRVEIE